VTVAFLLSDNSVERVREGGSDAVQAGPIDGALSAEGSERRQPAGTPWFAGSPTSLGCVGFTPPWESCSGPSSPHEWPFLFHACWEGRPGCLVLLKNILI